MQRRCAWLLAVSVLSLSIPAANASIQRVDFQPVGAGSITQAGFEAVSANSAVLASGISITTTGLFFDRTPGFTNGGAFTYKDLLDDFAYAGPFMNVGNAPITLTIGNLEPLTAYSLRIYSADQFSPLQGFAGAIKTTYTPTLGTGLAFSSIFNLTQNPTTNQQYSGLGLLTSNASGQLRIQITAAAAPGFTGNAFTRLNGLELEKLPEPASLAVWSLLGTVVGFIAWRKYHTATV